ncbi:MAG: OmpA family protein [Bacteroidota bacterium]
MKARLFIFLSIFPLILNGQPIIFQEDFDDNNSNWREGTDEYVYREVKNGIYYFHHYREKSYWTSTRSIFIEPTKDFEIEVTIKQERGTEYGYGLIYAANGIDNYHCFLVTSNGYFCVGKSEKGIYKPVINWQKNENVKPINEWNVLKVRKSGDIVKYHVNGIEVGQSGTLKFFGTQLGFLVSRTMNICVDKLLVRQDLPPINLIEKHETYFEKEDLGESVNSNSIELSPVISPDGNTLFFVRKDHPENKGGDDIWFSKYKDGYWGKAKFFDPLNNLGHNSVISVTPSNNMLFLTNTYHPDGSAKGSGFSISRKTSNGWAVPEDVIVKDFYNNNQYIESCLGADGKTLVFTVERDDTHGNRDIYASFWQEDGSWSEPLNLGARINTFADEMSPFLAADGKTLYYSTIGKRGYGNNDIFLSRRLDDSWTNWSEPENLGPSVNTEEWDAYYTLPASGEYAYFASYRSKTGTSDLFRIKLPASAKPKPVVLLYGKVLNKQTNEPVEASISYYNLENGKELGVAQSNPVDGSYKIVLPAGTWYGMVTIKKGYFSINENINLSQEFSTYKELEKNLLMVPVEVGQTARLNNIFFDSNKHELKSQSIPELNLLVKFLKENPGLKIEISGHTDNQGDVDYNQNLSENRAFAVYNYLLKKGIPENKLSAKGYGEIEPVATNETAEGRQLNRRVEFKIMEIKEK